MCFFFRLFFFFLMIRRPPRSTRTDTLFPYTTLFRSAVGRIVLGTAGRPVRTKIRACTHDIADVRRDAGGRPYPFFRQRRILGSRIPHRAPPDPGILDRRRIWPRGDIHCGVFSRRKTRLLFPLPLFRHFVGLFLCPPSFFLSFYRFFFLVFVLSFF